MRKYWPALRVVAFLVVGLMNTVLIRTEEIGTWKNYLGYLFLALVVFDVIMFTVKKIK